MTRTASLAIALCVMLPACRELNPDFQASLFGEGTSGLTDSADSNSTTATASTTASEASSSPSSTTTPPTSATTDPMTSDASSTSTGPPPPVCGDGVVDPGEDCDDMNDDNTDDCVEGCIDASCGDGFIHAVNEECDGAPPDGETCASQGQPGGGLACDGACMIDNTGCACGNSQAPVGGMCPPACTGGCDGTTCNIDCQGNSACEDDAVACPAGWDCAVDCDGNSACNGATITCNVQACTVACAGNFGCRNATVTCGAGTCAVACSTGNSVCDGIELQCGPNDGSITCTSTDAVVLTPDAASSCMCTQSGCM